MPLHIPSELLAESLHPSLSCKFLRSSDAVRQDEKEDARNGQHDEHQGDGIDHEFARQAEELATVQMPDELEKRRLRLIFFWSRDDFRFHPISF